MGQKLQNGGNGWTDWYQICTHANSSGNEHRQNDNYPLENPEGILRGLCGQKLKPGQCGQ